MSMFLDSDSFEQDEKKTCSVSGFASACEHERHWYRGGDELGVEVAWQTSEGNVANTVLKWTYAAAPLMFACSLFDFAEPTLTLNQGGAGSGGASDAHLGGSSNGGVAQGGTLAASGGSSQGGTSAGASGASGQGCNGSLPFPQTQVLDDFNRTSLGNNWESPDADVATQYSLTDGQISTFAGRDDRLYWSAEQGPNQEAFVTLVDADRNIYQTWLILKSADQSYTGFEIDIQSNTYDYLSIAINDGGLRDVNMGHAELRSRRVLGARSWANGCVEVFVDGVFRLSADLAQQGLDPQSTYARAKSWIGFTNIQSDAAVSKPTAWDDFGGGQFDPSALSHK